MSDEAHALFCVRVLELLRKYDAQWDTTWYHKDGKLIPAMLCNDFFVWACSDATVVENDEDLALLEQSFIDAKAVGSYNGGLLYCARKEGMRPQGAYFAFFRSTEEIELFKTTGPEREPGFGNPYSIEKALERYGRKEGEPNRPTLLSKEMAKMERIRSLANELHKLVGGDEGGW